jgi:hypothetical protein
VELTESSIKLFWSGDGTRYAVERATQEAGPWTYLATWENNIATTEYTDTGLTSGATYWYRARGYNAEQVVSSPCSAISVTTIIVTSSYTTKVGSNEEWVWRIVQTGEAVPSGTIDDWFWRTWNTGSQRKVPRGEAHDWIWGDEGGKAELTTTAITGVTTNAASSGGNISSDGGSAVTARGVCWNTTGSPTIADSKTTDGSGTGSFTSSLTGLTGGTLFYVRAYATNSEGTAYGNQVSFTTLTPLTIGLYYKGGYIFYIDGTGQHGLVCASWPVSTSTRWRPGTSILTGASGTAVGTGQSNTTKIVNAQGAGSYAASLCNDYIATIEGVTYDDWFLPSIDELNLCFTRLYPLHLAHFSNSCCIWSSSEYGKGVAWYLQTPDAFLITMDTSNLCYAHVVRTF